MCALGYKNYHVISQQLTAFTSPGKLTTREPPTSCQTHHDASRPASSWWLQCRPIQGIYSQSIGWFCYLYTVLTAEQRNLPARGFRPAYMLLGMGALMTYGFWRVGQGIREQKYVDYQHAIGQGAGMWLWKLSANGYFK